MDRELLRMLIGTYEPDYLIRMPEVFLMTCRLSGGACQEVK